MNTKTETVLTVKEIADRWRCSTWTVRDMIPSGRLQAFRVGHELRVTTGEVERIEKEAARV